MVILSVSRNLVGLTKGPQSIEVNGETVGQCLNDLVGLFPAIKNELFFGVYDRLYDHVQVKVNRKKVDAEDRLTKKIKDGDEIDIVLQGH